MPPIFDDYGDENNYSVESAPITIVHVGSINSFIHVAHDRDALCDSYIVISIHDATESYYERGKHGLKDLNNGHLARKTQRTPAWKHLSVRESTCEPLG
jgi:hypothetical protein